MSRWMDFVSGTVECCIKNTAPERLFNLCKSRGIILKNIYETKDHIYFTMKLSHYRSLRPIVRKCRIVPHICRRRGLPFIIHKNRRHWGFFAGIGAALALLVILSGFVWNIEIYGNYGHTDETLIACLKDIGVHTGQLKSRIDLDDLEDELRLAFDDISWVSARIDGTVLKIDIKEGLVLTPDEEKDVPGNVIAQEDGVVSSIVTRTGTALVKAGDTVSAGDVLISGTVDIYNDDGTIKETRQVHGDGDVYIQSVYYCEDYYPARYIEKDYTGRERTRTDIELFGQIFSFGSPRENESGEENKTYTETVSTVTKYRLTPSFYLPVRLYTTKTQTYTPKICTYTSEEMETLGNAAIQQKLSALSLGNVQILSHDLSVAVEKDYYVVRGNIHMISQGGIFEPYGS